MVLVGGWSGLLAAGFAWAAVGSAGSPVRATAYALLAVFLGLLALRTGYELVRRLRGTPPG